MWTAAIAGHTDERVLLFPQNTDGHREGLVQCRERLGGFCTSIIVRQHDGESGGSEFWPYRVEGDNRIDEFQRPRLPGRDLVEDRIRDDADQLGEMLMP